LNNIGEDESKNYLTTIHPQNIGKMGNSAVDDLNTEKK
jgi:hypothetical protein